MVWIEFGIGIEGERRDAWLLVRVVMQLSGFGVVNLVMRGR